MYIKAEAHVLSKNQQIGSVLSKALYSHSSNFLESFLS